MAHIDNDYEDLEGNGRFFFDWCLRGSKINVFLEKTLDKSDAEPKICTENLWTRR